VILDNHWQPDHENSSIDFVNGPESGLPLHPLPQHEEWQFPEMVEAAG
jgi:hypothetical protein